jgi:hypothetical protein
MQRTSDSHAFATRSGHDTGFELAGARKTPPDA